MQILTAKQIVLEGPKVGRSNAIGLIQIMDGKAKLKPFQELQKGTIQSHRRWQRVNLIYSIFDSFSWVVPVHDPEILNHVQLIHHGHQQELIQ